LENEYNIKDRKNSINKKWNPNYGHTRKCEFTVILKQESFGINDQLLLISSLANVLTSVAPVSILQPKVQIAKAANHPSYALSDHAHHHRILRPHVQNTHSPK
jgi:hypothetical protein